MKRLLLVTALLLIAGLTLIACNSVPPTTAPTTAPVTQPTTAPVTQPTAASTSPTTAPSAGGQTAGESEAAARAAGLTTLADAYAGKFKGQIVTMTGPFVDADAVKFNNSMKAFQDATGIQIQYSGSKTFEASITTQVQSGAPPDVVDFPQPGLAGTFAKQGKVVAADTLVPMTWLKQNYKQSWLDIPTVTGPDGKPMLVGIVQRFSGKDEVWYPKAAFDKAGYKVPQTWDDLMTLTDQIAKDGDTAWCLGIGSGAATGWPATDWIEALLLRTTTPENYDKWVAGTLKFDSPEVRNAIGVMDKIWKNPKYVYGGTAAIVSTQFSDAPTPMFQNPPKCWLHKQGNFITSFFPQTAKAGVDYDFFYLPPVDPKYGKPYEVAGDIMVAFNNKPATAALMQLFSTGAGVKGWLAAGGALGPQNDVNLDWYGDPIEKKIAGFVKDSTVVRFDGSDLMPGAVGAGSFWKGMTDYYSGAANLDTVLKQIDASWPK
ncbi:MAG: ABC transporter substrate-binding protein [Anaerolineae bacterium]